MGGFKKFEAAKFDERNVAAAELDFEDGAVMARAEQHGLLFQGDARFTVGKHALDGKSRLRGIVANRNERRLFVGASIGPEIFGEALFRERDYGVGGVEDRHGRAIVPIQGYIAAGGWNCFGKSRMFRILAALKA
jgi:hypothetical protein